MGKKAKKAEIEFWMGACTAWSESVFQLVRIGFGGGLGCAGLSKETLAAAYLWEERDSIAQSGPLPVSGWYVFFSLCDRYLRLAVLFYALYCISESPLRLRRSFLPVEIHFSNFVPSTHYFEGSEAYSLPLRRVGMANSSCGHPRVDMHRNYNPTSSVWENIGPVLEGWFKAH